MCQRAVIAASHRVVSMASRSEIAGNRSAGGDRPPADADSSDRDECYWPSQGFHFASFSSTHFLAASSAVMSWFVM
jgi:hypothetical protein